MSQKPSSNILSSTHTVRLILWKTIIKFYSSGARAPMTSRERLKMELSWLWCLKFLVLVTLSKSMLTTLRNEGSQGNYAMRHCSLGPFPTQSHRREIKNQPFENTGMKVHSSIYKKPNPNLQELKCGTHTTERQKFQRFLLSLCSLMGYHSCIHNRYWQPIQSKPKH